VIQNDHQNAATEGSATYNAKLGLNKRAGAKFIAAINLPVYISLSI